jgi:cation diffusion facilitator family transporter
MSASLRNVPRGEATAALASVGISVLLLIVKFVAYYLTGSAAIFSDALEGIVNVAASAFAAYSLFLAHQPADEQHPYGHGKVEFLSAGFEGGMILVASIVIVARAGESLVKGPVLEKLGVGIVLMAAAGITNGLIGLYLLRAGRRSGAITLEADGKHLLSDAITSVAVLTALGIVRVTGWAYADPIAAICVAIYIALLGVSLLRRSAAGLMDEQDRADNLLLRRILDSHVGPEGKEPHVCSYHKLRHRHSGRYHWVDFHIMVPSQLPIEEAHRMASAIEYEIELAIGEGNATAHVEPCHDDECPSCYPQAKMKIL